MQHCDICHHKPHTLSVAELTLVDLLEATILDSKTAKEHGYDYDSSYCYHLNTLKPSDDDLLDVYTSKTHIPLFLAVNNVNLSPEYMLTTSGAFFTLQHQRFPYTFIGAPLAHPRTVVNYLNEFLSFIFRQQPNNPFSTKKGAAANPVSVMTTKEEASSPQQGNGFTRMYMCPRPPAWSARNGNGGGQNVKTDTASTHHHQQPSSSAPLAAPKAQLSCGDHILSREYHTYITILRIMHSCYLHCVSTLVSPFQRCNQTQTQLLESHDSNPQEQMNIQIVYNDIFLIRQYLATHFSADTSLASHDDHGGRGGHSVQCISCHHIFPSLQGLADHYWHSIPDGASHASPPCFVNILHEICPEFDTAMLNPLQLVLLCHTTVTYTVSMTSVTRSMMVNGDDDGAQTGSNNLDENDSHSTEHAFKTHQRIVIKAMFHFAYLLLLSNNILLFLRLFIPQMLTAAATHDTGARIRLGDTNSGVPISRNDCDSGGILPATRQLFDFIHQQMVLTYRKMTASTKHPGPSTTTPSSDDGASSSLARDTDTSQYLYPILIHDSQVLYDGFFSPEINIPMFLLPTVSHPQLLPLVNTVVDSLTDIFSHEPTVEHKDEDSSVGIVFHILSLFNSIPSGSHAPDARFRPDSAILPVSGGVHTYREDSSHSERYNQFLSHVNHVHLLYNVVAPITMISLSEATTQRQLSQQRFLPSGFPFSVNPVVSSYCSPLPHVSTLTGSKDAVDSPSEALTQLHIPPVAHLPSPFQYTSISTLVSLLPPKLRYHVNLQHPQEESSSSHQPYTCICSYSTLAGVSMLHQFLHQLDPLGTGGQKSMHPAEKELDYTVLVNEHGQYLADIITYPYMEHLQHLIAIKCQSLVANSHAGGSVGGGGGGLTNDGYSEHFLHRQFALSATDPQPDSHGSTSAQLSNQEKGKQMVSSNADAGLDAMSALQGLSRSYIYPYQTHAVNDLSYPLGDRHSALPFVCVFRPTRRQLLSEQDLASSSASPPSELGEDAGGGDIYSDNQHVNHLNAMYDIYTSSDFDFTSPVMTSAPLDAIQSLGPEVGGHHYHHGSIYSYPDNQFNTTVGIVSTPIDDGSMQVGTHENDALEHHSPTVIVSEFEQAEGGHDLVQQHLQDHYVIDDPLLGHHDSFFDL